MHVKVSAGFHLKNKPKEWLGVSTEWWNFGDGDPPATLEQLGVDIAWQLAIFHMNCGVIEPAQANEALRNVAKTLLERVDEVEKMQVAKKAKTNHDGN